MRSERVEETTEANRAAADSAASGGVWSRKPLARDARIGRASSGLAALLASAPGGSRDAVPRQAAEGAGAAVAAERVAGDLERIRLEREVEALRVELARAERLAALGRLASAAAHDFNNVLTAIVGHADLLELELPGGIADRASASTVASPARADLDEIRAAAARGAALVASVLDFGRSSPTAESELDLGAALVAMDGMLRCVAGPSIRVRVDVARDLPSVRVERARFERSLLNLVANARHAIEARPGAAGEIEVRLAATPGKQALRAPRATQVALEARGQASVRLTVRDDGCGMDAEVRRHACEPWFTTRAGAGGTGLGLAGVAEWARRAGGQLEIESAPGAGTEIRIDLPVPAPAPTRAASPARPATPASALSSVPH